MRTPLLGAPLSLQAAQKAFVPFSIHISCAVNTHRLLPPSLLPSPSHSPPSLIPLPSLPSFPPSLQRFGFTVCSPDDIPTPSGALDLYRSPDYWILSAGTVHHNGQERKIDFNLESLRIAQSISCSVNHEGELKYWVDGKDPGYLGWTGLPTERPLWGFADIYGLARKIKSEFLCGE